MENYVIKFNYIDRIYTLQTWGQEAMAEGEITFENRAEAVETFRKMKETEYRLWKAGKRWNRLTEIELRHKNKIIYKHYFLYR